jgi:hypothetical protein
MTQFGGRRLGSWGSKEEEGEYGYAAYHQGAENGKHEAHIEPAVLVQPLGESTSEAEAKAGAVVRLCKDAVHETGSAEPCARFAWFGSGVVHWVTKHIIRPVEHVWNTVGRYVSRGATEAWKASGASGKAIWEVGKAGFEDWANSGVE